MNGVGIFGPPPDPTSVRQNSPTRLTWVRAETQALIKAIAQKQGVSMAIAIRDMANAYPPDRVPPPPEGVAPGSVRRIGKRLGNVHQSTAQLVKSMAVERGCDIADLLHDMAVLMLKTYSA